MYVRDPTFPAGRIVMVSQIQFIFSDRTVEYSLKASSVEAEKQPLLGNARTQQYRRCYDTRCDAYSRCYGATGEARMRWRHETTEEVLQAACSVGPLRDYMTRPTEFCSASKCSAVEGSVVEC
jgi:hypothetical protein